VTDNGEQERAAELARQAEALREQGMPIYRVVQEYIAGTRAAERGVSSAARQIGEAMDMGMAEVFAAVRKHVIIAPNQAVEARVVLDADTITLSEGSSVIPLVDIVELSARASRDGIAGFSIMQVLALVLVWLLSVGSPVVQVALPPEAQTVVSNEYATLGIAIAITLLIVQNRKR
jgi:hypothetical protein